MIIGNCLCMSALALKITSEGILNTGDQKKLRLVSLSSYVWNCYVMKIVIVAGTYSREFSECEPWP